MTRRWALPICLISLVLLVMPHTTAQTPHRLYAPVVFKPAPSPTVAPTATATATASPTPTITATPSETATALPTQEPTTTGEPTPTANSLGLCSPNAPPPFEGAWAWVAIRGPSPLVCSRLIRDGVPAVGVNVRIQVRYSQFDYLQYTGRTNSNGVVSITVRPRSAGTIAEILFVFATGERAVTYVRLE
jgi:hypothetical protein